MLLALVLAAVTACVLADENSLLAGRAAIKAVVAAMRADIGSDGLLEQACWALAHICRNIGNHFDVVGICVIYLNCGFMLLLLLLLMLSMAVAQYLFDLLLPSFVVQARISRWL
jgi:hypothetical protein